MKWAYLVASVFWMGVAVMSWFNNDKSSMQYAFIIFWLMVVMAELSSIKSKMDKQG